MVGDAERNTPLLGGHAAAALPWACAVIPSLPSVGACRVTALHQPRRLCPIFGSSAHNAANAEYLCVSTAPEWLRWSVKHVDIVGTSLGCAVCGSLPHYPRHWDGFAGFRAQPGIFVSGAASQQPAAYGASVPSLLELVLWDDRSVTHRVPLLLPVLLGTTAQNPLRSTS